MSEEFNSRLRTILAKLFHSVHVNLSPTIFIADLQRQNEKCTSKQLQTLLTQFAKVDKIAEQIYQSQVQANIKAQITAVECLKCFLTTYDELRKSRLASRTKIEPIVEEQRDLSQTASTVSDINETRSSSSSLQDEPRKIKKSSTRPTAELIIENISRISTISEESELEVNHTSQEVTTDNLSEILKKVAKAASDGLSKNAQKNNIIKETSDICSAKTLAINMRTHSQWFFDEAILKAAEQHAMPSNCSGLPLYNQEQLIIDDLLYLFIGLPGDHIIPIFKESDHDFGPVQFKISDQIDISLQNIVQDILPMASHFSIVQKFAQWSAEVKNQILQALAEVLQDILNDYRISICQLEKEHWNGALNLHKLLYLIRPNMQKLQVLTGIVTKINATGSSGGRILSLLFDEITLQTGDLCAQKMVIELTEVAAEPYFEMLERWILKGVIVDQWNQFFIVDHGKEMGNNHLEKMEDYDAARYWECRYTIQPERIPRFLENDADIILRTGKYLNVIRQCGKQITSPFGVNKLEFSALNSVHSTFIKQAYHNASKTLLDLLVKDNNLMGHISSVKRYFLLQQGDLITQFMDASEEELSKNVDKVTPVKLDNLLQLIVRLSSAKHDPCLEHLHCDLFTMDLADQMSKIQFAGNQMHFDQNENMHLSGIECFTFKYNVQWPVSLVLNQWALSQYQMLFRFLFYCKHVERQLCKIWMENIELFKTKSKTERSQWRSAFALRQRMLNAIQQIENYTMVEVIEPNWHIFIEKMQNVQNVDEVMVIHQDFLHACLQNCMLNYPVILGLVMSICASCLTFCKFIQSDAGQTVSSTWQKHIDHSTNEFNDLLIQLLSAINNMTLETTVGSKLTSLVGRINFNGFYNEQIENYAAKNNNVE